MTTHKNVPNYYNEKCTYNVNTHCNLLYALKVLIKLLFIKARCLIDVNVSLEADLEGQEW